MTRKKVSEIRRLIKRFFIEKPEKMLPECFRGTRERMVVQDSYLFLTKKHRSHPLFRSSLYLNPFTGLHIVNVLASLAGMITQPFEIAGDENRVMLDGPLPLPVPFMSVILL
jgi:hypothetical protein